MKRIIALVILSIVFVSCRTIETIKTETEYITIHDTLRIVRTDCIHDTMREVITLTEEGDTIYRDRYITRYVYDTAYNDRIVYRDTATSNTNITETQKQGHRGRFFIGVLFGIILVLSFAYAKGMHLKR